MKRSALRRSKPLRRSSGTRPRPAGIRPVVRDVRAVYDGFEWRRRVFEMHGPACVVTGLPAAAAHHVVPKQTLRRELAPDVYAVAVMDPRNGLPLSDRVHAQHHAALPKLPATVLKACHREFAVEHGLGWLLDREYRGETEGK